jgi:hypothetical protein
VETDLGGFVVVEEVVDDLLVVLRTSVSRDDLG